MYPTSFDTLEDEIPEGWFLDSLCHVHSPIIYHGDIHESLGWEAKLQHKLGGRLMEGRGLTPQEAFDNAKNQIS
jgi:hypothetical protein